MKYGTIYKKGSLTYPGWDKIYDSDEESISWPVSSITVSGLTGDTDEIYLIQGFVKATGSNVILRIRPNNDSGSTYGYQFLSGSDSTISGGRSTSRTNVDTLNASTADYLSSGEILVYAKSGTERLFCVSHDLSITATTVTGLQDYPHVWSNTADEITSLVFFTSSSSFADGTRIVISKKVTS